MREPTDPEVMILCAALELPAGQRAAFLDRVCAADSSLRRGVESLLRAAAEAGAFLESPAGGQNPNRPVPPASEAPGDRIGPYRLLEQIGEGGFGVVYAAEQEEPVRRRVALNIIKPGMDTRHVIARFEAESQALALMDHPYIARVLDAGATGAGRPYFVMELVPEVRITEFGVAKATQGRLGGDTLVTASGQVIGTPAYMSPEQAATGSADIDGPRLMHRLKGDLDWIVAKSLEKERARSARRGSY